MRYPIWQQFFFRIKRKFQGFFVWFLVWQSGLIPYPWVILIWASALWALVDILATCLTEMIWVRSEVGRREMEKV